MNAVEAGHQVVSNKEWLEARKAHLAKEKAFSRQHDELMRERRELPWVKLEKEYVFEGPQGKVTLADLFDGKSQLVVYHFMFGPEWEQGCPSCSMVADTLNANFIHVTQRDVALAVSLAGSDEQDLHRSKNGWVGGFRGCLLSAATLTMILLCRLRRRR